MGGDSTFKIAKCDIIGRTAPDVIFREIGNLFIVSFNRPSLLEQADEGEAATQETTQEKIITSLRAEPILTRKLLARRLGISEDGVKYHLNKLKAAGRIRHVGPTKAGRWEVIEDHLDVSGGGVGDDE
ncbi:MAG: winged helix-turn-helix transcriptional regulator [Thermodesulfobacteriota bacterium]|nr:winged helix-turn-helix transcriptional regulator [Thermodesulfobacteriota bacterium]